MLTRERVQQLLRYDHDTGKLFWVKRRGVTAGREAGCLSERDGYRRVGIDRRDYLVHRVIWLLHTGSFPDVFLDHANRDKTDNRLANLRPANMSENMSNRTAQRDNTTGFKGVCFDKNRGLFLASIKKDRKQFNLGRFSDPEKAHAAYCAAAEVLHGEFRRTS